MFSISARRIARPRQLERLVAKKLTISHSRNSLELINSQTGDRYRHDPQNILKTPHETPRNIAVLGGGLTGLSTALFLSEALPKTRITVYEGSGRTGGWIDGQTVDVKTPDGEKGTVLFERGARMVQVPSPGRPKLDDLPFWELVSMLNLTGELVGVPRGETLTKYIYYPDHLAKVPEPSRSLSGILDALRTVIREPLYKPVFNSFMHFMVNREKLGLPLSSRDTLYVPRRDQQSLGEYFVKACGSPELVDNMLSAVIHGVWGGDIWKLSDERAVPGHYDRPRLLPEFAYEEVVLPYEDSDLVFQTKSQDRLSPMMIPIMNAYSHVWFRGGFGTLTEALRAELAKRGVEVRNELVESLRDVGKTVRLLSKNAKGQPAGGQYEKIISTINAATLAKLAPAGTLPTLADTHSVNIMAVNLWYPTPNLNHPHSGFGYLIPQGVAREQNPEKALGVLFDTDRELAGIPLSQLANPNAPKGTSPIDTVPGTKLTVLMGGHYWDKIPRTNLPTPKTAIRHAKAVVARHLGIPKHENDRAVASAKLCEACIPQHYVGHWSRLQQARDEVQNAFKGKLAVAGPSYQMPGVLGSIRAAKELSNWIAGDYHYNVDMSAFAEEEGLAHELTLAPVGPTGLERFAQPRYWFSVPKKSIPWRYKYVWREHEFRWDLKEALEYYVSEKK